MRSWGNVPPRQQSSSITLALRFGDPHHELLSVTDG
jgi:hypothetical protein